MCLQMCYTNKSVCHRGVLILLLIVSLLLCDVTGCSSINCTLPDCRCPGADIPGGVPVNETPMMVLLTFDDGIASWSNIHFYRQLNEQHYTNPNKCPAKFTYYVSGDNYQNSSIQEVYQMGHEFGSHSLSHRFPTTWWATAGYDNYTREMVGMRDILATIIPEDELRGMRVPFLQIGGDDQYRMMVDNNFMYDTSMVSDSLSWPFTLDYPLDDTHCMIKPCPASTYKGLWEIPLNRLIRADGYKCSMADDCNVTGTVETFKDYLYSNFNRHLNNSKTPFGIYVHATWFDRVAETNSFQALKEFLHEMVERGDVWLVSEFQLLDWTRHPRPVINGNYVDLESWDCFSTTTTTTTSTTTDGSTDGSQSTSSVDTLSTTTPITNMPNTTTNMPTTTTTNMPNTTTNMSNTTTAESSTTTEIFQSSSSSGGAERQYNLDENAGMIAGIAAVAVIGIMLLIVTINVLSVLRRRKRIKKTKTNKSLRKESDMWDRIDRKTNQNLKEMSLKDSANGVETLRHM